MRQVQLYSLKSVTLHLLEFVIRKKRKNLHRKARATVPQGQRCVSISRQRLPTLAKEHLVDQQPIQNLSRASI